MSIFKVIVILLNIFVDLYQCEDKVKPNVVFIIADDLGWNDVSFHGSDAIQTPNLDVLAYDGVILNRHYVYSTCTPTRTSLLTGQYTHKLGMQGHPLRYGEARAIPKSEKLLPQYLKDLGYATHLVGKWHVGMSRQSELPTARGFDSHFGLRGGYADFYEYLNEQPVYFNESTFIGLDLFDNLTPSWNTSGYLTRVLTERAVKVIEEHDKSKPMFLYFAHPATHSQNTAAMLEAPPETIRANRHLKRLSRRIFAAMTTELDKSVGEVIKTLETQKILDNTIIIFMTDNGGVPTGSYLNWGSNYPLRGQKFAPLEGGVRVPAFIWAPWTKISTANVWNGFMHVSDWLPTILAAVDGEVPTNIDGINQWDNIIEGRRGRNEIVVDIDDVQNVSAIIRGDYKLIYGEFEQLEQYKQYGRDLNDLIKEPPCYQCALEQSDAYLTLEAMGRKIDILNANNMRQSLKINCDVIIEYCTPYKDKVCLFNLLEDPCELHNVADQHPDKVSAMKTRIEEEWNKRIPRNGKGPVDPASDPNFFNHVWETWLPDQAETIKSNLYMCLVIVVVVVLFNH